MNRLNEPIRIDNRELLGLSDLSRECDVCKGDLYLHAWAYLTIFGKVVKCSGESLRFDNNGNINARDGIKCVCGCRYWKNDKCIDCGLGFEISQNRVYAHSIRWGK